MLSVDQLDPSFGDGGVAGVPLPAAVTVSYGRGMARLADGSLVTGVAGGTGRLQVARFTAAGAPVTTFGAGGVASLGAPGAGGSQIVATDVAAAPGGKVVVAGTRGSDGLAVARYLDDGTPDPTFGTGGLVTTNLAYSAAPLDTYDVANAVAVQPDGKVLVGGRDGAYWALVRYTAAGALDPTFGDGGAVRFDQLDVRSSGTEGAGVQGIAVAADGRIVVAGRNFTPNLGDGTLVVRLTADGAPDATFDGDGKRPLYQTTGGGSQPSAGGVAVRPDGRVLVGGSEAAGNPVVYALTAAGSPDPTFDADGKAVVTGQSGVVVSAELDADGRLLLGGASFATLFAADGSLVRSFGVDGKLVSPALKFGTGAVFTAGADVAMAGVSTAAGGGAAVAAYRTAPQVHVVPTRATTTEGIATWGALTVERTGDTSAELTLPLSVGGTATAGDDYVALPASVTIPAGQTGVRLDVAPIDDAVLEGPETVVLSTAGASGYLLARPSATVTINDNEIADAGEPNEDLDAPSVLTLDRSGLSLGRSLGTAADVDVYALDLTGTGLRVDVVRTAGTDAVELDLFDAARNPVGHSSTGGPAEGVTLAAATTGRYYVRVRHAAAGGGYVRYTLSAGTRGPRFTPPPQVSSTAAVTLPTASFDVGGEGLSAHDTEVTNTGNTDPRPLAGPDFRKYRPTGATADVTVLTDARPGEWLEFTIDAAEAGDYGLVTRAVAAAAGGTFHVEVDGVDATGPLAVPANAAAGAPTQPVTAALSLTAGQHVLRLVMDAPQAGGATVGEFESIEVRPAKPVVRVALPGPAVTREPESPTDGSGLAFKISRAAGPADAPLTVRYAISGTATPGADYVVPSGEVTIPAGAGGFANAIVNLLADYKYEDAETLTLTILPSADYTIAGPASVSYTVNDFHPTPSPYEPNNTPATANNLYGVWPEGVHVTADLAPGDVDYYRAGTVSTDGTMTATLSFAAADGDLYLVAFDAAGNEVARSDTPGDTEALSFRTGELADFTFGVFGKDGASNGRYKLDVNWTEANAPTAAFYPALGFGPQSMMTVVFDEPVYNVDLSDFELTRDGQPVDMAAAGARLGWTTGGTRIEDLSAATGAGGRYLLRLKAAGSGIVDVYGNPLTADAVVGWYNELSPMPQVAIVADRDAGVRGGADAGSNFGSAPQMAVAAATGTSPAAAAYLSFDLSGVRRDLPLADAYVRVFVRAADDVNDAYLTVGLAASDAWTEGGLTFSNRPAVDTSEGGQAGVSGTAGQWVSLDVTRYLNARLAAGATRASFAIVVPGGVPGSAVVDSREAGETAPRLLVRNAIPRTAVEFDTEQLVVPEGGTATVGVRLNKPIDSPVYAQFGVGSPTESDLSCPPTIVTFTPANWNVFQPIVVSAAQDADTDHGYATMSAVLPQAGVLIGTLPVREQDDDLATVETVVRAAADATVEDGTTRAITPSTELVVRKGTTAGANREAYLRFDVTGLPAASSLSRVKVRLYGRSSTGAAVPVGLFPVTSTSWGETTVTWSTKPATSATPVAAATVSGTAGAWYEFDVTDYVKARKAAGATAVSFALKGTAATTAYATFASDEATANRPELRAARLVAATPQSIVVSASSLTLGEGKTATFTVRLATKPKANVTVTIGRAAGDASVSAAPASITFTPLDWDKPKTVTVAAAQDADRLDAKATIAVAADGLLARKVTVTATDDDKSTAPRSLAATAAANVRDGTYAGTNFGTSTELTVKRSTTAGSSRVSVLKFDLSALPAVTSGKLRLYGRLAATGAGATVNVYGSAATGWSETGVNWSNQPAAGALLATLRVTSTSNAWYEVDLTAYLAAERAAGRTTVTLVLKSASAAEPQVTFASDEASANRPVLMAGG